MRKRNHRHTRAKSNYSRRGNNDAAFENGLLRDQYTYRAKTKRSACNQFAMQACFAKLIDDINH